MSRCTKQFKWLCKKKPKRLEEVLKTKYHCVDGPFMNGKLWLHSLQTIEFCFKDFKGFYEVLNANPSNELVWVSTK